MNKEQPESKPETKDEHIEQIYQKWANLKRQADDVLYRELQSEIMVLNGVEFKERIKAFEERYEKEVDAKRLKGF